MAQQECGPEEAFDLLRQASQRTNIKVHVLAAHIVEHVTSDGNGDDMAPISPGTSQVPEPGNTGPRHPPDDDGQPCCRSWPAS